MRKPASEPSGNRKGEKICGAQNGFGKSGSVHMSQSSPAAAAFFWASAKAMRSSNWTPSIVPSSDDQDACLVVVNDFGRRGGAYCETDVEATDLEGPFTGELGTCVLRRVVYAASLRVCKAARDQAEIEVEGNFRGESPEMQRLLANEAFPSKYNRADAVVARVIAPASGLPSDRHPDRTNRAVVLEAVKVLPSNGGACRKGRCDGPTLTASTRASASEVRVGTKKRLSDRTKKLTKERCADLSRC